jgi:hypothetical protein
MCKAFSLEAAAVGCQRVAVGVRKKAEGPPGVTEKALAVLPVNRRTVAAAAARTRTVGWRESRRAFMARQNARYYCLVLSI